MLANYSLHCNAFPWYRMHSMDLWEGSSCVYVYKVMFLSAKWKQRWFMFICIVVIVYVRATTRIYYVVPRNYFYCIRCYYHSSNLLWASLRIFPSEWNLNLHWEYFTSMLKKSDKRLIVYLCDRSHRKLHAAHLRRRSLEFSTKIVWGLYFLAKTIGIFLFNVTHFNFDRASISVSAYFCYCYYLQICKANSIQSGFILP